MYTLHYVLHELKWSIPYYKHVITPLPFAEIQNRDDREILLSIHQSLAHLEINGSNTIIAGLPDGQMITCCDSKKLRPVVVGGDEIQSQFRPKSAESTKFCPTGILSAIFTRMSAKSS